MLSKFCTRSIRADEVLVTEGGLGPPKEVGVGLSAGRPGRGAFGGQRSGSSPDPSGPFAHSPGAGPPDGDLAPPAAHQRRASAHPRSPSARGLRAGAGSEGGAPDLVSGVWAFRERRNPRPARHGTPSRPASPKRSSFPGVPTRPADPRGRHVNGAPAAGAELPKKSERRAFLGHSWRQRRFFLQLFASRPVWSCPRVWTEGLLSPRSQNFP